MRPGRFDKLLYVGHAMNFNSRLSVLTALTRKYLMNCKNLNKLITFTFRFNISEEVKLEDVVNMCPNNISGADFYGICAESWMHAARRTIEECENGELNRKEYLYLKSILECYNWKLMKSHFDLIKIPKKFSKDDSEQDILNVIISVI